MSKKLTHEHVDQVFKDGGCELLSKEYIGARVPLKYRCSCGNESVISLNNFQKGQRCQKCADKQFSRRYTIEYIKNFFEDNGCVLLSEVYKDNRTLLDYICNCGEVSKIRFYNFKQGVRCKKCGGTEKLTLKYVEQYFEEHGCKLLETEYINARYKMKYICECGEKNIINFNHFQQGKRCKKCGIKNRSGKNSYNYDPKITDEERKLKRFYPEYYIWRKSVYVKNDYTCQKCFQRGVILNAHHIINYSSNKELRLDGDNGITMCKSCHKEFHHIYGKKNNTRQQLNEFLKISILCLK